MSSSCTFLYVFIASYDDVLEIPLQPLYDNLDSYTYEVFEKDPVKYIFYQRAIEQALLDKISDDEAETKTVSQQRYIIHGVRRKNDNFSSNFVME